MNLWQRKCPIPRTPIVFNRVGSQWCWRGGEGPAAPTTSSRGRAPVMRAAHVLAALFHFLLGNMGHLYASGAVPLAAVKGKAQQQFSHHKKASPLNRPPTKSPSLAGWSLVLHPGAADPPKLVPTCHQRFKPRGSGRCRPAHRVRCCLVCVPMPSDPRPPPACIMRVRVCVRDLL